MPREGEPSRKTKMNLRDIVKINIVKPAPTIRRTRETQVYTGHAATMVARRFTQAIVA
jgi:hypothetical protein